MNSEKQKGITLVAMIITIILILILAGTTINIVKDNGLFKHATNAVEMHKMGEYQEILEIIGMDVKIEQLGHNVTENDYMEEYQYKIQNNKNFFNSDVVMEYYEERLVIQVVTEEGYVFWIRKSGVEYKGKKDEVDLLKENVDVYVSLNGTILSFFNNEQKARENADTEEHYYGNITEMIFSRYNNGKKVNWWDDGYLNTPWYSERDNISKVNIVDTISPYSLSYYFADLKNVSVIENFDKVRSRKATDLTCMFFGCRKLEKIDISRMVTKRVERIDGMFYDCESLKEIDVSNFITDKVTSMDATFDGCASLLKINVSKWNTSKVTNINNLFGNCSSLKEIDVSNFDTSNVTSMTGVFDHCSSLEELDLSNFDTHNVKTMHIMFRECTSLKTLNISNFTTNSVTEIHHMFSNCRNLEKLNMSKLDISNRFRK